jgi:mRNA interferase HigB
MRIISKAKRRAFWAKHPKAEEPLNAWHRAVEHADWSGPNDVRNTYRTADPIGAEFIVFDIGNNDYRLVVCPDYKRSTVYIWDVYTHPEYDRIDFRALAEQRRRERREKKRRDAEKGR